MPQKYRLLSLIVICFTLLFFTWMIRDSLCELHIKQENYELAAFLACKLKSKNLRREVIPAFLTALRILITPKFILHKNNNRFYYVTDYLFPEKQIKKSPPNGRDLRFCAFKQRLQAGYVTSCRAFSAAFDGEGHFLTFVQRFVTIVLDSREVYEHVFRAIVRSDEAEAFVSVEPFYDTSHFTGHSVLPLIINCAFRRYGVLYRF